MLISKDIFAKCKLQDRRAQQKMYAVVYSDIMRISLRYVQSDQDAQDILNRAMLKVFTKIHDFKGDHNNLGGWIRRIIINEALDFIRKQKSFNDKIQLEENDDQIDFADDTSLDEDPTYILRLLKALPIKVSSVFNLYVIEGYSHKEIGEMLEISEANSKWNLHAARTKLQVLIKQKQLL